MLQAYLAQGYGEAAEAEQRQFERLLELPDDRLEDLLLGRTGVPEGEWGLLAAKIRSVSPL
jgi:succinate dehydrogenase flavin-adding protein (antitoxin of CptAB toxin-antitoxin module)